MVIAVDIDNVICNLQEVVVNLFNKRYGSHYTLNDFIEYDVMNILSTQDGIVMRDMYSESGLQSASISRSETMHGSSEKKLAIWNSSGSTIIS